MYECTSEAAMGGQGNVHPVGDEGGGEAAITFQKSQEMSDGSSLLQSSGNPRKETPTADVENPSSPHRKLNPTLLHPKPEPIQLEVRLAERSVDRGAKNAHSPRTLREPKGNHRANPYSGDVRAE